MSWTDQQLQTVHKLWQEGHSAGVIAEHVDKSRNAVIGIIHRRKWYRQAHKAKIVRHLPAGPRRAKTLRIAARRIVAHQRAQETIPRAIEPPSVTLSDAALWEPLPGTMPITDILELKSHHCRWPIGTPTRGYCGCTAINGASYCATHARRSSQPPTLKLPHAMRTAAPGLGQIDTVNEALEAV